jgi:hypothetical protein
LASGDSQEKEMISPLGRMAQQWQLSQCSGSAFNWSAICRLAKAMQMFVHGIREADVLQYATTS